MTHIEREEQLIRELDQIDPEKLRVSPSAPPSQLQIARAELELVRDEVEELVSQRDELLTALRNLLEWQAEVKHPVPRYMLDNAAGAIANATSAQRSAS